MIKGIGCMTDLAESVLDHWQRHTVVDQLAETELGQSLKELCAELCAFLRSAIGQASSVENRNILGHFV